MLPQRLLLAGLLLFAGPAVYLRAEVPPLSKEKLDAASTLIVIGTVTDVTIGERKSRADGSERPYTVTVLVQKVLKGKFEIGSPIVVRGVHIALKSGFAGSMGHYAGNTHDGMNSLEAGWELALHLSEAGDGVHDIISPNGFSVLSKPPRETPTWPWLVAAAAIAGAVSVLAYLRKRRPGNRALLAVRD